MARCFIHYGCTITHNYYVKCPIQCAIGKDFSLIIGVTTGQWTKLEKMAREVHRYRYESHRAYHLLKTLRTTFFSGWVYVSEAYSTLLFSSAF